MITSIVQSLTFIIYSVKKKKSLRYFFLFKWTISPVSWLNTDHYMFPSIKLLESDSLAQQHFIIGQWQLHSASGLKKIKSEAHRRAYGCRLV